MDAQVTHDAGEPRFFLIIGRPAPDLSHMENPGKNFLIRVQGCHEASRGGRRHRLLIFGFGGQFFPHHQACVKKHVCTHPLKLLSFFLIIRHVLDVCVTV